MEEMYNEELQETTEAQKEPIGKILIGLIVTVVIVGGVLFACQNLMKSVPYEPGKIIDEENVYVNDFFKIRFECPEGYRMNRVMTTDEDLKDLYGDNYRGTVNSIYQELKVEADGSLSSMNINVGKGEVDILSKSGLNRMDEIVYSSFGQVGGVDIDRGEPYTDYLGEEEYKAVDYNFTVGEKLMKITIFTRTEKGYTIMLCFSDINESVNDLFEGFVKYKK